MTNNKQLYIDFEAYERLAEPHKRERASLWRTAIGLQDVDGLKVSDYLKEAAVKHIEGDITIDDVRQQLKSYYVNKTTHDNDDAEKGVEPNKSFLVKFFRNLMLGEQHELKNRYMLIGYNDTDNTHTSTHTSTRTSTSTSTNNLKASLTENVKRLILAIGTEEKSVKEMMEAIGLKNRPNFLEYSLTPAISDGFVTMKYPSSPRHPRQKYLLTVKGLAVYDKMSS